MKEDSFFLPKFNLGSNEKGKNTDQSNSKKLNEIKFWDEFYDFSTNKGFVSNTNTTLINQPKIDSKLLRRHTVLTKKSSKYTPSISNNYGSTTPRNMYEEKIKPAQVSGLESPFGFSTDNPIFISGKNFPNNKLIFNETKTIVPQSDPKTKELTFWNQLYDLNSNLKSSKKETPILSEQRVSTSKTLVRRNSEKKIYEPTIQTANFQLNNNLSKNNTPRDRSRLPENLINHF